MCLSKKSCTVLEVPELWKGFFFTWVPVSGGEMQEPAFAGLTVDLDLGYGKGVVGVFKVMTLIRCTRFMDNGIVANL